LFDVLLVEAFEHFISGSPLFRVVEAIQWNPLDYGHFLKKEFIKIVMQFLLGQIGVLMCQEILALNMVESFFKHKFLIFFYSLNVFVAPWGCLIDFLISFTIFSFLISLLRYRIFKALLNLRLFNLIVGLLWLSLHKNFDKALLNYVQVSNFCGTRFNSIQQLIYHFEQLLLLNLIIIP